MTKAAQEFVTPLSVGALTGGRVFTELFDRTDEQDVGHIRLAREASLIVVAPATADLMAKMATGQANDLASAVLLAARVPVLLAPAMNPAMWAPSRHPAQRRDAEARRHPFRRPGIRRNGREPARPAPAAWPSRWRSWRRPNAILTPVAPLLAGRHVLVTSGPTHEPIDPVRYLANRSSGRQGHAIAEAAAAAGARVTLVSGPVTHPRSGGRHHRPCGDGAADAGGGGSGAAGRCRGHGGGGRRLAGGGRIRRQDQEGRLGQGRRRWR